MTGSLARPTTCHPSRGRKSVESFSPTTLSEIGAFTDEEEHGDELCSSIDSLNMDSAGMGVVSTKPFSSITEIMKNGHGRLRANSGLEESMDSLDFSSESLNTLGGSSVGSSSTDLNRLNHQSTPIPIPLNSYAHGIGDYDIGDGYNLSHSNSNYSSSPSGNGTGTGMQYSQSESFLPNHNRANSPFNSNLAHQHQHPVVNLSTFSSDLNYQGQQAKIQKQQASSYIPNSHSAHYAQPVFRERTASEADVRDEVVRLNYMSPSGTNSTTPAQRPKSAKQIIRPWAAPEPMTFDSYGSTTPSSPNNVRRFKFEGGKAGNSNMQQQQQRHDIEANGNGSGSGCHSSLGRRMQSAGARRMVAPNLAPLSPGKPNLTIDTGVVGLSVGVGLGVGVGGSLSLSPSTTNPSTSDSPCSTSEQESALQDDARAIYSQQTASPGPGKAATMKVCKSPVNQTKQAGSKRVSRLSRFSLPPLSPRSQSPKKVQRTDNRNKYRKDSHVGGGNGTEANAEIYENEGALGVLEGEEEGANGSNLPWQTDLSDDRSVMSNSSNNNSVCSNNPALLNKMIRRELDSMLSVEVPFALRPSLTTTPCVNSIGDADYGSDMYNEYNKEPS